MSGDPGFDKQIMQTAAIWWTELRDSHPSADLLQRWEAWMISDPAHAQAFAELNALGEMVASAPPAQRRQCIDEFAPRRWQRRQRWLAAAAVVVVAVLGAGWMLRGRLQPAGSARQYLSAVAENREFHLPDGTFIQLGAASKLVTHYAVHRRDIALVSGEAFFTVTHDANRPFEVAAGPLHIEDLGTAFDVRRTGERVSVAVTEGHVRLSLAKGAGRVPSGTSGRLDLVAGQRAEYDPVTDMLKVSDVSAEHAAAWRDHRLEFVNEPLAVVMANVNRYSLQPVRFDDPGLGKLMFTGTVNTTTIGSWLKGLPQIFPVRLTTSADHVVLSDARRR